MLKNIREIIDQAQIINDSFCAIMMSFVFGLTINSSDQISFLFLLTLYLTPDSIEDIALEIVILALSKRVYRVLGTVR